MTAWKRGTCRECGGSKPAGIGRKLCDSCLEQAKERAKKQRREYHRRYYLENRDKILAREAAYREADPEGYRRRKAEDARRWQQAHPERTRETARRGWARRKYGLTLEEVDALLARGCAICGTKKGSVVGKRSDRLPTSPDPRLCIDHDHANGKVRGALCHSCNTGLGSFGDDASRLRAAAEYLEKGT